MGGVPRGLGVVHHSQRRSLQMDVSSIDRLTPRKWKTGQGESSSDICTQTMHVSIKGNSPKTIAILDSEGGASMLVESPTARKAGEPTQKELRRRSGGGATRLCAELSTPTIIMVRLESAWQRKNGEKKQKKKKNEKNGKMKKYRKNERKMKKREKLKEQNENTKSENIGFVMVLGKKTTPFPIGRAPSPLPFLCSVTPASQKTFVISLHLGCFLSSLVRCSCELWLSPWPAFRASNTFFLPTFQPRRAFGGHGYLQECDMFFLLFLLWSDGGHPVTPPLPLGRASSALPPSSKRV